MQRTEGAHHTRKQREQDNGIGGNLPQHAEYAGEVGGGVGDQALDTEPTMPQKARQMRSEVAVSQHDDHDDRNDLTPRHIGGNEKYQQINSAGDDLSRGVVAHCLQVLVVVGINEYGICQYCNCADHAQNIFELAFGIGCRYAQCR